MMPDFSGLETLPADPRGRNSAYTYMILMTSNTKKTEWSKAWKPEQTITW